MWKGIREANEWYLGESFLLPKHTFDNPTWLSEVSLRAYWRHWYNLSQSGQPFTFKRTGAHDVDGHSDSGESQGELPKEDMFEEETKGKRSEEEEEEEGNGQPGKSDTEDGDKHSDLDEALTPDQCHSFGQKIKFLSSLASSNSTGHQDIINILAQMEVSSDQLSIQWHLADWSVSRLVIAQKLLDILPNVSLGVGRVFMVMNPSTQVLSGFELCTSGLQQALI